MGVVPPDPGFLRGLRDACDAAGALLVFDEVITGFRISLGGAQEVYDVVPDLTILGKVMGGGLPCAAFGGRRDVMEQLAPSGPVYQAGTLSGNPVAVAAGIAALRLAADVDPYPGLKATAKRLQRELTTAFAEAGVAVTINRAASMLSLFFREAPVRTYRDAAASDHRMYARFFHAMLARGVYLPPSGYEQWTLATAHGPGEIDRTLAAAREAAADI
jgi:glutamate-1-semialdehyde 2,1-aminomutase